jgi:replicative DNA helicase
VSDDYDDMRTPPHDLDAERSVLGAMMLSKDAIADVVEILHSTDFYRPAHEMIFDAIVHLYGSGEPADAVTVMNELTKRGNIGKVGHAPYLHTLVASVSLAANAGYHATIVHEKAQVRRLIEALDRVKQVAYSGEGETTELLDMAESEVFAVAERRMNQDYIPAADIVEPTITELEAIQDRKGVGLGVPTGFADLDDLTQGLHPGQMIIVAARPALGKSTLAVDFCRSASIKHGMTSCIFSLEMSRTEIMMRVLSAEAKVPLQNMRAGRMTNDDWDRIARKIGEVTEAPLYVDDSPNLTMMEIRAKARRLKQRHDLKLIVIDYLQLMSSGKRVESRQLEVSEFSRQIKLLAKELEVPVVAVCQLNRGPEQRSDKKPSTADLRESGSLEQDSDVVILLFREDAYEAESTRPGEADLIVAKQRNGPTRTVTVAFQGHYSRFVDMAR